MLNNYIINVNDAWKCLDDALLDTQSKYKKDRCDCKIERSYDYACTKINCTKN